MSAGAPGFMEMGEFHRSADGIVAAGRKRDRAGGLLRGSEEAALALEALTTSGDRPGLSTVSHKVGP